MINLDNNNYNTIQYEIAARRKNEELNNSVNNIENYKKSIQNLLDDMTNNFPNDQNFYMMSTSIINEINKEIQKFNTSVGIMKHESIRKARIKDQNMIYRAKDKGSSDLA